MRSVRFSPNGWAVEPGVFGRAESIRWKRIDVVRSAVPAEESDVERRKREHDDLKRISGAPAQRAAAQMQHAYAVLLRSKIKASNSNLTAYARRTGAAYDHLNKVTRGDVVMTLEDIARAHQAFGDIHPFGIPLQKQAAS